MYRAIKADKLGSLIFYGPPGYRENHPGEGHREYHAARSFAQINATIRREEGNGGGGREGAKELSGDVPESGPSLFVDEIHRFNKGQQDYLLPFVEDGTVILIGATTENPYFEVNGALLSRSSIFELKPLDPQKKSGSCF